MTDNGIIQALEFIIRRYKDAAHHVACIVDINILKEALDLIKRQDIQIYDTDINLKAMRGAANSYKMELERLKSEIEEANEADREAETQALKESKENAKLFCEAINNAKSEVVKEFTKKVDELLERYSVIHENAEAAISDVIECDNETIEMQSVWDVHTLIKNEMSEYEEMYRLQDNIENIAKERLLKEIEKDLRLLIKEMAEES